MDSEQFLKARSLVNKLYIFGFGKDEAFEEALELLSHASNIALGKGKHDEAIEILNFALETAKGMAVSKKCISNEYTAKIAEQLIKIYFQKELNESSIEICMKLFTNYFQEFLCIHQRFTVMAEIHCQFGNYFYKALDYNLALESYNQAQIQFENANLNSGQSNVLNQIAKCYIGLLQFNKAHEIYTQLATLALKSPLTSSKAHCYHMNAILCVLAHNNDVVYARDLYTKSIDNDYRFESSNQGRFIGSTLNLFEKEPYEVSAFVDLMADYDSISKFAPEQVTILLKIKNELEKTELSIDLA